MSRETEVSKLVTGRWGKVLPLLGVNERVLDGHHHPCPVSGEGEDRFRFSNHKGRGNFFCACNAGKADGFKLLECMYGWDFKTAAAKIREVAGADLGMDDEVGRNPELALKDLKAIQKSVLQLRTDHGVRAYLQGRGLDIDRCGYRPGVLHDAITNYGLRKIGIHAPMDAMAAKYSDAGGNPCTWHLTYLQDGRKAQHERSRVVATPVGKMAGGAVRLMRLGEDGLLGVGEGIETSFAAAQLFKQPVWATLNAAMLEAFVPPAECKRLRVFADNDGSYTGQAAAYALAKRCRLKHGIEVEVIVPDRVDTDWNDVLNEREGGA